MRFQPVDPWAQPDSKAVDPANRQEIDVFIPTYNSALHLQECIDSVRKSVPVNRIVLIDHYSRDGTLEIGARNNCQVVSEDRGLGYARELSFQMAETEILAMIESDLVYHQHDWYPVARKMLVGKVGAVVIYVPRTGNDPWKKYSDFWTKFTPLREAQHGFTTGSTLLRTGAVRDISIPHRLGGYEDGYIARALRRRGLTFRWLEVKGIHYADYPDFRKGRWYGANARILYELDPSFKRLLWRQLTLPVKGALATLYTLDPRILGWTLTLWLSTFVGWANPEKYRVMRR
jgi:glycosyltransferase involved in cell wall biosynthesis